MISIIGAGPAGSAIAYLLAKSGQPVTIYEEHHTVGRPVECTGLVTSQFTSQVKLDGKFLQNKIRTARIYAPNGRYITISLKQPNLVIDRTAFDRYMAQKAKSAGARLKLNSRFTGTDGSHINIFDKASGMNHKIQSKTIIGADGPSSTVAKSSGIFGSRQFLYGAQAVAELDNDNAIEFYPHVATFGWIVPVDRRTVRIGVLGRKDTMPALRQLLKLKGISKQQIKEMQGGVVPLYNNKIRTYRRFRQQDIYLIGDAATQVKATTGGGIIPGLKSAAALRSAILNRRDYESEWKSILGCDLWLHLYARKIMDRFSDSDWNKLVRIFSKKQNLRILEDIDRDNATKLFFKLGIREPRLWQFALKLFG